MKPRTLALAGLEQEDITDFRRVFGKLRSQLGADWRLVDDTDADLSVVDIDSIYGHMDWLKLTASGMRTAVYTSAQYAKESDLVLFKPLKADNLADILNAVAAESDGGDAATESTNTIAQAPEAVEADQQPLPSEPVQARSEESKSEPAAEQPVASPGPAPREVRAVKQARLVPVNEVAIDSQPSDTHVEQPETVGAWLLSRTGERPVRITTGDETWILDPDRDAYYGPATLKPLAGALSKPPASLHDADVVELEKARKGSAQPLARLRWYAGLKSTPGELNPALMASKTFKLARWPQIEREFPRHFRIATAMMKQAGSVAELSQASGAPESDVADFINASHAVDIVEYSDGRKVAVAPASGSVMSRLRSSLGR